MINQLLNEIYFDPKLEKKEWVKLSNAKKLNTSMATVSNLKGGLRRKVFYTQEEKIDTDEKFTQYLKNMSLESLEQLEQIILGDIIRKKHSFNLETIQKVHQMSLLKKCEHLGISWYFSDRNVQNLFNYYNGLKK